MKSAVYALIFYQIYTITTAEECTSKSRDFFSESTGYINCLGVKINKEFQNLKTDAKPRPKAFVEKKREEILGYFEDDENECTPPRLELPIRKFLDDYPVPDLIKNMVPRLQNLVWELAKRPKVSECIVEYLRRNFLQYIRKCTGANIPTKAKRKLVSSESFSGEEVDETKPVLDPVPVFTSQHDLKAAQDYIELLIKSFVALSVCKKRHGNAGYKNILRKITAEAEGEVCDCAQNNYDNCKGEYKGMCKETVKCIGNIIDDPEVVLPLRKFHLQATLCAQKLNFNAKSLEEDGARLLQDFARLKRMKRNGDPEYKKFGDFVSSLLKAMFNADFCDRCNV